MHLETRRIRTRLLGALVAVAALAATAASVRAQAPVPGPGSRATATALVVARVVAASPEASLVSAGAPAVAAVGPDYVELTATVQVRSDTPFRVAAEGTSASAVEVLTTGGEYVRLSAAGVTVLAGPATGGVWRGTIHYRVPRARGERRISITLPVRYSVMRLGASGT